MKLLVRLACFGVLAAMTWVTVRASLDRSVLVAGAELWADPWGRAALFDAYFAFLAVWAFMAYREKTWPVRLAWLVGVCLLGNFAIAFYILLSLHRLPPGAPLEALWRTRREVEETWK